VKDEVADIPELQDGVNYRLVEDLGDIAEIIEDLVADTEKRKRLGLAARETFCRKFTREALLSQYESVLSLQ
jgi:glycosyltransferase involved in cell wall biosynthesis